MKYDERYLSNRDIDWFFRVNGKPVHVSSAGGSLPDRINDIEILREIQYQVSLLPDINTKDEVGFNQDFNISLETSELILADLFK